MTTPDPREPLRVRDILTPAAITGGITTTTIGAALTWGTGPTLITLGATTLALGLTALTTRTR